MANSSQRWIQGPRSPGKDRGVSFPPFDDRGSSERDGGRDGLVLVQSTDGRNGRIKQSATRKEDWARVTDYWTGEVSGTGPDRMVETMAAVNSIWVPAREMDRVL